MIFLYWPPVSGPVFDVFRNDILLDGGVQRLRRGETSLVTQPFDEAHSKPFPVDVLGKIQNMHFYAQLLAGEGGIGTDTGHSLMALPPELDSHGVYAAAGQNFVIRFQIGGWKAQLPATPETGTDNSG